MTKLFFIASIVLFLLVVLSSCKKNTDMQSAIKGLWEKRLSCSFDLPCTDYKAGNGNRIEFKKNGVVNFYENGRITSTKKY